MRKILLDRRSPEIQSLRSLVERQKHRTLVMWNLKIAEEILSIFEMTNSDPRPRLALEAARAWARGKIKMPTAKHAALEAHKAASESNDPAEEASARAMGHVVGCVHVETHALGVVFYGITAMVRRNPETDISCVLDRFEETLLRCEKDIVYDTGPWAPFLLREDSLNKELLLHQSESSK